MKDLHQALFNLSKELPALPKDGLNPHFKSRYTKYDTIMEKIGPLLEKHELLWITGPSYYGYGDCTPTLTYSLIHVPSGDKLEGEMTLAVDKANPQGQGSALTYARRYCITTVLNLIADEDDDGNAASTPKRSPARKAQDKAIVEGLKKDQAMAPTFAQRVKAAGLNAEDIRLYLGLKMIEVPEGAKLADFLNDMAPKQQAELLAYANGDPQ